MAFAGRCGLDLNINGKQDVFTELFNEELEQFSKLNLKIIPNSNKFSWIMELMKISSKLLVNLNLILNN